MDFLSLSATDGYVIAMLSMMLLSMGVIAVLVLCMRRNVARRDRQVDELLEEVAAEEARKNRPAVPAEPPKAEPWERDGDWWKS